MKPLIALQKLVTPSRRTRRVRLYSALIAAIPLLPAAAAAPANAQTDCDRFPAGSTARDSCYRTEYWRAHDAQQRAYDEREAGDRYLRNRRDQQQREIDRAWRELNPEDRDDDR